jgi:hypothetical protein
MASESIKKYVIVHDIKNHSIKAIDASNPVLQYINYSHYNKYNLHYFYHLDGYMLNRVFDECENMHEFFELLCCNHISVLKSIALMYIYVELMFGIIDVSSCDRSSPIVFEPLHLDLYLDSTTYYCCERDPDSQLMIIQHLSTQQLIRFVQNLVRVPCRLMLFIDKIFGSRVRTIQTCWRRRKEYKTLRLSPPRVEDGWPGGIEYIRVAKSFSALAKDQK